MSPGSADVGSVQPPGWLRSGDSIRRARGRTQTRGFREIISPATRAGKLQCGQRIEQGLHEKCLSWSAKGELLRKLIKAGGAVDIKAGGGVSSYADPKQHAFRSKAREDVVSPVNTATPEATPREGTQPARPAAKGPTIAAAGGRVSAPPVMWEKRYRRRKKGAASPPPGGAPQGDGGRGSPDPDLDA